MNNRTRARRRDEMIDNLAESLVIPNPFPARTVALIHLTAVIRAMAEDIEAEAPAARFWAANFMRQWIGSAVATDPNLGDGGPADTERGKHEFGEDR